MARRKRFPTEDGGADAQPKQKKVKAPVPPRNRGSPSGIVKLYNDLTDDQKSAITDELKHGSLLAIKCDNLHNPLLSWLTKFYSPKDRAFVFPGRGVIPVTEESIQVALGLPRGPNEVSYYVDSNIDGDIAEELYPGEGTMPKVSRVAELLVQYKEADNKFNRLWMVYIVSTLMAPTTDIHVSTKVYPMLVNIEDAENMNLCKFVADYMHESFSNKKFKNGCMLYIMLMYASSLDLNDYILELDDVEFLINRWTRYDVEAVSGLDMMDEQSNTFGRLKLQEEFAAHADIFGGPAVFQKWMSHRVHPSCSTDEAAKVGSIVYNFARGLDGLLSKLVFDWTSLAPTASQSVEAAFNDITSSKENLTQKTCSQQANYGKKDAPSSSDSESSNERDAYELRRRSPRFVQQNTMSRRNTPSRGQGGKGKGKGARNVGRKKHLGDVVASEGNNVSRCGNNSRASSKSAGEKLSTDAMDTDPLVIPIQDSDISISDHSDSNFCSQHADNMIRKQAAHMVSKLGGSKKLRSPVDIPESLKEKHGKIKKLVAAKLSLLQHTCAPPPWWSSSSPNPNESLAATGEVSTPTCGISSQDVNTSGVRKNVKRVVNRRSPSFTNICHEVAGDEVDNNANADVPQPMETVEKPADVVQATSTAIILSPKVQKGVVRSSTNAIVISPSVRPDASLASKSGQRTILLSPLPHMPSPVDLFSQPKYQWRGGDPPVVISMEIRKIISDLSAAAHERKWKQVVISDSEIGRSKPRDSRMGMFTPPQFHLFSQSSQSDDDSIDMNVDSSPEKNSGDQVQPKPVLVTPLAVWDPSKGGNALVADVARKDCLLSAFLDGTVESIDEETAVALDEMEANAKIEVEKRRAAQLAAGKCVDDCLQSATPKPVAVNTRVKKVSKFCSSPFDEIFKATAEQEAVYKLLMRHTSSCKSSNIQSLDIVKYHNNWVDTRDLADSMKGRSQLSTRMCDIAVEWINANRKNDKRIVIPYLVTKYMADGSWAHKVVTKAWKKTKTYSLSAQNQVLFMLYENMGDSHNGPFHWFVISLNLVAKRFEVMDSLRGENNASLIASAENYVGLIKEGWNVFYDDAKNQISGFGIKYIDVPKQGTPDDCGYFGLNNAEKWEGEHVPPMKPEDVEKVKKIWPYRLLSSNMNLTKKWKYYLARNKMPE